MRHSFLNGFHTHVSRIKGEAMWQRFTERARDVVFLAQKEAARLDENYVNTEHLLLAIVKESECVAARILRRMSISSGRIRSEVERQVTRGDGKVGKDMQLTPRAKRVIDLAYDEARQLSNNYIGTEHLLLGLIREGEGLAGRVLAKLGVELERTRREVMALQDNDVGMIPPVDSFSSTAPTATGITSSSAAILFEHNYRKLSLEQQESLRMDGLLLSELPPALYITLKVMAQPPTTPESVVLAPKARLRVQKTEDKGRPSYTVHTDVTLLTTLLVVAE